jgi:hypothetical protein
MFIPRREASALVWGALGVLAVSAAGRTLFRSARLPSTDPASDDQEPDVLLDVTELEVDRINLEVEELKAHVAILAAVASLLDLSVGVDARLHGVKLEIEGVRAKAVLKARLKHVRAILEKALDIIAENPEILRVLGRSLDRLVREGLGDAQAALAEALEGLQVGDTVDEVLRGKLEEVQATLDEILQRSEVGGGGDRTAQPALPLPAAETGKPQSSRPRSTSSRPSSRRSSESKQR